MPGSQENEFPNDLNAQIRFIQDSTSWDQLIARFQRITDSFRRIGPPVVEAESSIRDYATALESDPMLDLRRGEYPCWDGYGTYWYDRTGIHSNAAGVCFVCRTSTQRMDIDLRRHFCNSAECNRQITEKK